jgi:hypothetical protein
VCLLQVTAVLYAVIAAASRLTVRGGRFGVLLLVKQAKVSLNRAGTGGIAA